MRKKISLNYRFFEIVLSVAALTVVLETIHFNIYKSSPNYTINSGAIFGMFGTNTVSLVVAFLALIIFLILWFILPLSSFGAILVLSGSLVNLIDRLSYGGTIDYISVLALPIFNLADVVIILGFVIIVVALLLPCQKRI